ncbi:MAG: hypothetical protein ACI4UA_01360, partial [Bacteroidaceae bacterium]
YNCFLNAITNLVNNHDVYFFKFDGISTLPSATGPDMSIATGEEDAEGIINIEREARKIKEDLFINTTVGTWASPFWYRFTDATWRQENDYGTIGNGSTDREKWITYRDRLVYQNYVQNSPLCPINTLMTHGVILTVNGKVATDFDYAGVLREIRCAFACGSGMVELYCDRAKLNDINGGALWGDIADCIKWQKENADVLPDIHWVGGNPWDGSNNNVYGWASWNGEKATFALRNPSTSQKTFTFTLRDVLDIPDYFTTPITMTKAFEKDADLTGLTTGEALDLDKQITVTLAASSVYVYNGKHGSTEPEPVQDPTLSVEVGEYSWSNVYTGSSYEVNMTVKGENLTGDIKVTSDNDAVTLSTATISKENGMSKDGYVVKVTLSPTEAGEGTANITFSTDGLEKSIVKTLTWTAQTPVQPVLSVEVNTNNWSTVYTGSNYKMDVTIKGEDLIGDITITSDNDEVIPSETTITKENTMGSNGYMMTLTLSPKVEGEGTANITFATEGLEDVVKTITWTAKAPTEFEEATRTVKVKASAVYGTLILPFSHVVPNGVRAFIITSVVDGVITMKEQYSLSAFVPYILYTTTGIDTEVSGKFAESAREKYDNVYYADEYFMGGVLFDNTRYTFQEGEYVMQSKNGGVAKFYKAGGYTFNVPAGKGFLKIPEESAAPSYRFVVDGETGIVMPSFDQDASAEVIYNLQGQRVFETQPGNIYIINGKKVLVK